MAGPVKPLKELTSRYGVSLDPITIMNALLKAGYAENIEYLSSTGSGELKSFRRLTEAGEKFGVNKGGYGSTIKTDARFFETTFPELLKVVVKQLDDEVNKVHQVFG